MHQSVAIAREVQIVFVTPPPPPQPPIPLPLPAPYSRGGDKIIIEPYLFLMKYQEQQTSHCGRADLDDGSGNGGSNSAQQMWTVAGWTAVVGQWQRRWRRQRRTATVDGGSGRRLWSWMWQGAPTVSGFYCGRRQWRWRQQWRTATVDGGS